MTRDEQAGQIEYCPENALGWNDAGKSGSKAECLAYIKEVWTDTRPLSLRRKMEESLTSNTQFFAVPEK
jgi:hypothetical protein